MGGYFEGFTETTFFNIQGMGIANGGHVLKCLSARNQ